MENFITQNNTPSIIMPDFVMKRPISFGAKLLYAILCEYASDKDHCYPNQKILATILSCSVSNIKTYMKELIKQQLIYIKYEKNKPKVFMLLPKELS